MNRNRLLSSALAVGALTTIGLASFATPAAAHVTAQPEQAEQGGYTAVTFRVPNERPDASTVKVEVTLPSEHPIPSVRAMPMPGWTIEMTEEAPQQPVESHGSPVDEVVRTISWTAEPGTRIAPDQYQEFAVSLGPLPENVDQLVMPAVQTYDSGEVVAWDQPPTTGAEPEHPAPVLELVPAGGQDGSSPTTIENVAAQEHNATDPTARWLGGAGLLVGALGVGFGAGAIVRRRRDSA